MTCEQAMALMSAELDGALRPEESAALAAHLESCAECKNVYEAMTGLEQQLSALREPAPEGLKKGILYRIDQASGKAKKAKRRWFGPGTAVGAVAAVLVLLVGTGVIPLGRQTMNAPKGNDQAPDHLTNSAHFDALQPNSPVLSPAQTEEYQAPVTYENDSYASSDAMKGIDYSSSKNGVSTSGGNDTPSRNASEEPGTVEGTDHPGNIVGETDSIKTPPLPVTDPLQSLPVSEDLHASCEALGQQEQAAVLLYTEFDPDSLCSLLETEEPELFALTKDLVREDRNGLICYRTDCGTILALHEWLLQNLPHSELMEPGMMEAETSLMIRMEALDPGSESLNRVISWAPRNHPIAWPEIWPEGWASRLRTEENWALFFPSEDYTPNADKPAYLVFARQDR